MSGTFIVYFTNALVYCYESYEYYRTTCGKIKKKNGTQIEDSLIINHRIGSKPIKRCAC